MQNTILVGEDDPLQRKMVGTLLTKKLGYKIIEAKDGKEVLAKIEASNVGEINAILLDIGMPDLDGFSVLKHIRKYRPDLPVIMLTADDDTNTAVKSIKAGASDFIVKPPDAASLDVAIKNAIKLSTLSRELTRMKRDKEGAMSFSDLIGHNSGLSNVVAYARKAASSDVSVLITGETGTGKELIARAIHGESRRIGAPFIAVNCSSIPKNMIESTLFGHEKGAIAGMPERNAGKLREAERGTIFLDDIHLLTPDAQAKLLKLIQEREIEPVGASKPVKVNIRIISATNIDLKAEVQAGRFREDLYFRLGVVTIPVPTLREHKQDIIPLTEYFISRISSIEALPARPLSSDAKNYLSDYLWPGNVRELESLVHRALVLCEKDEIDRELLIQIHDSESSSSGEANLHGTNINIRQANGLFKTMHQIEMEAMQTALSYYENNITRAAEALGIAKSTFYRKIKDTK